MRCLACGAEMRLIEVINDGRMAATGFERHISKCSGCSRIRWRWEVAGNRVPIATLPANHRTQGTSSCVDRGDRKAPQQTGGS
jgi:hypothetical protein